MLNFFKRNLIQIYNGGFSILIKKLIKLFKYLALALYYMPSFIFFGIPFIIFSKALSFFIIIRLHELLSSRIGHFVGNIDLYIEEKKHYINSKKNKKYLDIFFLDGKITSNLYVLRLWKKKLLIFPRYLFFPIFFFYKLFNLKTNLIGDNKQQDRDVLNLLENAETNLYIPESDKIKGREYLNKIGVKKNQKFICLNVRDSAYLPGLEYHNYRDGDIDDYILAAETLAKKGYAIFRMGKKVNKKIATNNPNIIDYANSPDRSDFLDVFLASECYFCLSTSSGFDALCTIFRKPIGFITVPIGYIYTFNKKYMSITKHHLDTKTNRKLSINEIQSRNCFFALDSSIYLKNNVKLKSNTNIEILNLALDMIMLIENNYNKPRSRDEKKFWDIFGKNTFKYEIDGYSLHGKLRSYFAPSFLNSNKYLIEDE